MTEVIGVRFKQVGKIYYFSPNGVQMPVGEKVIVETARGIECGEVALSNREIEDEGIVKPLKTVIRVANKEDLKRIEDNKAKEKKAFRLCLEKIEKHKLEMKLVDVEYTFDNNKILFYFTADGRIDFRELVKDLASVFKTRIELRQIGVRDETKMVGGIGIAPGANINYDSGYAIFEATHGTAPNIAGKNVVNPCSLLLSSVMMLEYMGWNEAGRLITAALEHAFSEGKATRDLARFMPNGQPLGTKEFGEYIMSVL